MKKNPNEWICKCSHRGNAAWASVWKDWGRISTSPCEHRQRGLLSSLGLFCCPFIWKSLAAKLEIGVWVLSPYWAFCCQLGKDWCSNAWCLLAESPEARVQARRGGNTLALPPLPASWLAGTQDQGLSVSRDSAALQMGDCVINPLQEPGQASSNLRVFWSQGREAPVESFLWTKPQTSPGQALTPRLAPDPLTPARRLPFVFSALTWLFSVGLRLFQGLCFAGFKTDDHSPASSPRIFQYWEGRFCRQV